jgi:hypothetical protein
MKTKRSLPTIDFASRHYHRRQFLSDAAANARARIVPSIPPPPPPLKDLRSSEVQCRRVQKLRSRWQPIGDGAVGLRLSVERADEAAFTRRRRENVCACVQTRKTANLTWQRTNARTHATNATVFTIYGMPCVKLRVDPANVRRAGEFC